MLKGFKDETDCGATIPLYHCMPTVALDLTSTDRLACVSRTKFQKQSILNLAAVEQFLANNAILLASNCVLYNYLLWTYIRIK